MDDDRRNSENFIPQMKCINDVFGHMLKEDYISKDSVNKVDPIGK